MRPAVWLDAADLDQAEREARRFSGAWTGTSGTLASWVVHLVRMVRYLEGNTMQRRAAVIGITGKIGAGKSLAASMVPGAVTVQLADPLYAMVSALTGIAPEMLRDRRTKEEPIFWLGKSPRQLLQTIGTEWGRDMIDPEIWVRHLHERISNMERQGYDRIVVADVRFDNEAESIRARGGKIWQVIRPGTDCHGGGHASERGVSPELIDRVIVNAGTPDDLRELVVEAARCSTASS